MKNNSQTCAHKHKTRVYMIAQIIDLKQYAQLFYNSNKSKINLIEYISLLAL